MGGAIDKVFGGGSSKPDNSAYERQLEEQRKATEAAERKAEAADRRAREQREKLAAGRAATILTGGEGDTQITTRKPTLGSGY